MTIPRRPPVECLLIDLDDTLYDYPELPQSCADNIRIYMREKLNVPADEVDEMCRELYLNYGTTLAGLVASGYKIDFEDWHANVHGPLPYHLIKPDPKLKAILDAIPVPKYVFTNADRTHAERCLSLMGLRSCFRGVIAFEDIMEEAERRGMVHHNKPVVCKPNRQAFELALSLAGGAEATSTAFFDDSTRNVASSHRMGLFTVLVGRVGVDCPAHVQMRSIHELRDHLPWLFAVGDGRPDGDVVKGAGKSLEAEELLEEANREALLVQA